MKTVGSSITRIRLRRVSRSPETKIDDQRLAAFLRSLSPDRELRVGGFLRHMVRSVSNISLWNLDRPKKDQAIRAIWKGMLKEKGATILVNRLFISFAPTVQKLTAEVGLSPQDELLRIVHEAMNKLQQKFFLPEEIGYVIGQPKTRENELQVMLFPTTNTGSPLDISACVEVASLSGVPVTISMVTLIETIVEQIAYSSHSERVLHPVYQMPVPVPAGSQELLISSLAYDQALAGQLADKLEDSKLLSEQKSLGILSDDQIRFPLQSEYEKRALNWQSLSPENASLAQQEFAKSRANLAHGLRKFVGTTDEYLLSALDRLRGERIVAENFFKTVSDNSSWKPMTWNRIVLEPKSEEWTEAREIAMLRGVFDAAKEKARSPALHRPAFLGKYEHYLAERARRQIRLRESGLFAWLRAEATAKEISRVRDRKDRVLDKLRASRIRFQRELLDDADARSKIRGRAPNYIAWYLRMKNEYHRPITVGSPRLNTPYQVSPKERSGHRLSELQRRLPYRLTELEQIQGRPPTVAASIMRSIPDVGKVELLEAKVDSPVPAISLDEDLIQILNKDQRRALIADTLDKHFKAVADMIRVPNNRYINHASYTPQLDAFSAESFESILF